VLHIAASEYPPKPQPPTLSPPPHPPPTKQVSERDLLVPPKAQHALAAALGARVLSLDIGHMGVGPVAHAFRRALVETVRLGEVLARAGGGGR